MSIIKIRKIHLNRYEITGLFFLIMVLFTRAMLLGNISQIFGAAMGVACLICYRNFNIKKKNISLLLSCYLFFLYCFLNGLTLVAGSRTELIIQITIYWLLGTYIAALLLGDTKIEKYFGKGIIYILCLCVISYIISLVLGMTIGWDSIRIGMFDYKYEYISPVFFPLTVSYGEITFSAVKIPRMLSIGREVGISQTIYIWAFFKAQDYFKKSNIVKTFMAIGVFCCLSTTGLSIFVILIILNKLLSANRLYMKFSIKKMIYFISAIIVVIAAIYLLLKGGNLSLTTRLDISYIDRTRAFEYGFRELAKNPLFGTGFMRDVSSTTSIQQGIALISSIGNIGIVGFFLFLNTYVQGIMRAEDKRKFILCNSSFLITTLFAQPLYTSAIIYIFMFMDYSKE